MKKRLAKKIFNGNQYFDIWYHPEKDLFLEVPRDGKCWYLIQKACYRLKHPELIDKIVETIMTAVDKN